MKRESLLVFDQTIHYTVRVSERAQRLRVAVYADGDVIVTKPKKTSLELLKKFVESKKFWIHKKLEENEISPIPALQESSMEHFEAHKDKALELVKKKVRKWNKLYNYSFEDIAVKPLKSRWGSCSRKHNLSFNYKVIFLPEQLQDYVVVHEICHLKEQNHSQKFWRLVGKALPEYQDLNKFIKRI